MSVARKKLIAIQFFGHLRSFRETYQSFYDKVILPNMANGYEIDIFMHSWDCVDSKLNTPLDEDDLRFIKENYKPKSLLIEVQFDLSDEEKKISTNVDMHAYFKNYTHTVYQSNKLRLDYQNQNNCQYDFVITTRADIQYLTPFVIDDYLNSIRSTISWLVEFKVLRSNIIYQKNILELDRVFEEKINKTLFYASNPQPVIFNEYLYACDILYFAKPDIMTIATSVKERLLKDVFTYGELSFMMHLEEMGVERNALLYFYEQHFKIIRISKKSEENKESRTITQKVELNKSDKLKNFTFKILFNFIPIQKYRKKLRKKYIKKYQ